MKCFIFDLGKINSCRQASLPDLVKCLVIYVLHHICGRLNNTHKKIVCCVGWLLLLTVEVGTIVF